MKKFQILILSITTALLFSCGSDDNDTSSSNDNQKNNAEVFNELVGSWIIQESTVDGVAVANDSFNCLKSSVAEFTASEYTLNYRKKGTSICSVSQKFSGTYRLKSNGDISLDSVNDNLSALLKDGKLIITSKEDGTTQVDTFINEKDIVNTATEIPNTDPSDETEEDDKDEEKPSEPKPDPNAAAFKALIAKLKGTWSFEKHTVNGNVLNINDCGQQNTISISDAGIITLVQNNTTYTQADLRKYGVGFSGSASIQDLEFEGSFGSGSSTDKITVNSKADCKLVKISTRPLEYIDTNEVKVTALTSVKWISETTIELHFENRKTRTRGIITFRKQ